MRKIWGFALLTTVSILGVGCDSAGTSGSDFAAAAGGPVLGQTEPPAKEWSTLSNPGPADDYPYSIAYDAASDAAFIGGWQSVGGVWNWRVEKRNGADGTLVVSFGTQGVLQAAPTQAKWNGIEDLALDPAEGTFYIGGFSHAGYGHQGNVQWRIEKRSMTDGSLVSSFGTGGVALSNPSSDWDAISKIALSSSEGALYALGNDYAAGHLRWRIEKRAVQTGLLVSSFGVGGVVTSDPGGGSGPNPIVLHPSEGTFFCGGYDKAPGAVGARWRIEKRFMSDGSLVPSFATAGVVALDLGPGDDGVGSLAIDPASDSLIAAGAATADNTVDSRWRIEKRKISDGSLIGSFGEGGVIVSNPTNGSDTFAQMRIDPARGFLYFGGTLSGSTAVRLEKRSLIDGSAVKDGEVTLNSALYGTLLMRLIPVSADGTLLFIAYEWSAAAPGDVQWRIERKKI